jgi:transcriptional regulator with XRE-family HTH domain
VDDAERVCRDIGENIRTLRRARSWTQEQLAEHAAVEPSEIRRFEAGDNVTIRTLVNIALALDVAAYVLLKPAKKWSERRPGRPKKRTTGSGAA